MIELDKYYSIKADSEQWVLFYEKENWIEGKEKPVISKNKWYCSTLQNALKRYMDESLKPCESVVHLSLKLNAISNNIEGLIIKK